MKCGQRFWMHWNIKVGEEMGQKDTGTFILLPDISSGIQCIWPVI